MRKLDIDFVVNFVESEGYKMIGEYEKTTTSVHFQCPEGHIYKGNFKRFKRGDRCPYCGKRKVDGITVYNRIAEKGLIPQFKPEEFENSQQKLYFLCPKHPEKGLQYVTNSNLKRNKYICHDCYLDDNRGEKHPGWKGDGGKTISIFLRSHIKHWKFLSLQASNFQCDISKETKDLEVHHFHRNFKDIIDEVFEATNIKRRRTVADYSDEELLLIIRILQELHIKHGLGIVLTKKLHRDFHKKYGIKNNTPEQYLEFKKSFVNVQDGAVS